MINHRRPYLIIPKLILQKTWGGEYIAEEKGIKFDSNKQVKLGQSYELFSGSKLSLRSEGRFYEVGFPDTDDFDKELSTSNDETLSLVEMANENPEMTLGKTVLRSSDKMPLLLKLTQAKGNSFQLHIKPGVWDPKWLPKSETWYFFEKGKVTCGIAKGTSIKDYKAACETIDSEMQLLSRQIHDQKMGVEEARLRASELINKVDPWQFVQSKDALPGEIFDMSRGGIHHSWEDDVSNSRGNILFEVQQDRMDPVSTIRSFDQGKIDDMGRIRSINIEDYFKYLDTSEELNQGDFFGKSSGGNNVFTTADYAMDVMEFGNKTEDSTGESFCHYYVKSGRIRVETSEGRVTVEKGWSCFVPAIAAGKVMLECLDESAVVLKTYVPKII